jgi:hypothetical protein
LSACWPSSIVLVATRLRLAYDTPTCSGTGCRDRGGPGGGEDRAAGKIEGKAEALIMILTVREMALDGATREQILGERDPQRLDRWLARGAIATTIAEVLTKD